LGRFKLSNKKRTNTTAVIPEVEQTSCTLFVVHCKKWNSAVVIVMLTKGAVFYLAALGKV
jgi:hypothetical protein